MEHKYPWQAVFEQITAADPKTLTEHISEVEATLTSRWQALANSPDCRAERRALRESIKELGRIQIEKLGYPDRRKLGPN